MQVYTAIFREKAKLFILFASSGIPEINLEHLLSLIIITYFYRKNKQKQVVPAQTTKLFQSAVRQALLFDVKSNLSPFK